jgi:hypothetical protein
LEGNPGRRRRRRRRRKGRPRKRWLDGVKDDSIKMGVKRWRTKATDRGGRRNIREAAKDLPADSQINKQVDRYINVSYTVWV